MEIKRLKIMELQKLIIKQQKEGLNDLTKEELLKLQQYYKSTLKYKQGLDRLASIIDLKDINKKLESI